MTAAINSNDARSRVEAARKSGGSSKADKLAQAMDENAASYLENSTVPESEKISDGEHIHEFDCHDIDPNPYQNRRKFDQDAIEKLAASIKQNKQVQAIGVRKVGNRYQIIWGERRWRAARLNPGQKIRGVIRELTDLEMILVCHAENHDREKTYDYETWISIKHLLDREQSTEQICTGLGIQQKEYYKFKKFGDLPVEIKDFLEIKPNAIQRNDAADLEKIYRELPAEHNPDEVTAAVLELMADYLSGKLKSRGEIVKKVKAQFVTKATRNREKVNRESVLKVNGTAVGTLVRTPTELRVSVSSEDLPADKFEEFEKLLNGFFQG